MESSFLPWVKSVCLRAFIIRLFFPCFCFSVLKPMLRQTPAAEHFYGLHRFWKWGRYECHMRDESIDPASHHWVKRERENGRERRKTMETNHTLDKRFTEWFALKTAWLLLFLTLFKQCEIEPIYALLIIVWGVLRNYKCSDRCPYICTGCYLGWLSCARLSPLWYAWSAIWVWDLLRICLSSGSRRSMMALMVSGIFLSLARALIRIPMNSALFSSGSTSSCSLTSWSSRTEQIHKLCNYGNKNEIILCKLFNDLDTA